jgi:hypothetical protein
MQGERGSGPDNSDLTIGPFRLTVMLYATWHVGTTTRCADIGAKTSSIDDNTSQLQDLSSSDTAFVSLS